MKIDIEDRTIFRCRKIWGKKSGEIHHLSSYILADSTGSLCQIWAFIKKVLFRISRRAFFYGGDVHWGYWKQLTDGRKPQPWPNGRVLKIAKSVVRYISAYAQRSPWGKKGGDRYRDRTYNKEMDEDIRRMQLTWTLDTISFNANTSRLFKLIRGLNNKYCDNHTIHEAILTHNNNIIHTDQQQAEILKHYSNISRLPHRRQNKATSSPLPDMTAKVIKNAINSGSTGANCIFYLHLKHLDQHAIGALTNIFNHSLNNNSIPNIGEVGKIIPILKPNKTPNAPTSYPPISLLCNSSKILETVSQSVLAFMKAQR